MDRQYAAIRPVLYPKVERLRVTLDEATKNVGEATARAAVEAFNDIYRMLSDDTLNHGLKRSIRASLGAVGSVIDHLRPFLDGGVG